MVSKIKQLLNNSNETPQQPHQPYEFDDDKAELKQTKTLKINNDNSSVKVEPPLPNVKENINKILASEDEQKKIVFTLTTKLLSIIKDRTLDENKDQNTRDNEKKVFSEYANFAMVINSSENYEEGYGTLSYISALSRCILLQRDRINELEYETVKLRKSVEDILKAKAETNK